MRLEVGALWQLRIACYTPNQVGINVINYRVDAVTGLGALDTEAVDELDNVFDGLYRDVLCAGARYRGCSLQRFRPMPRSVPVTSVTRDGVGNVAGDLMATQVAGIISFRTAFAGPRFRGRIYLPFPSEASNFVDGLPTAGYVVSAGLIAAQIIAPHTVGVTGGTSTLIPILWHRDLNTYDDLVAVGARQLWATQRRRGSYGRLNPMPF